MPHTLFESSRIIPLVNASGTVINTTANGTSIGTCPAGDYEYHAFCLAGSIANTGTVFAYAVGAGQTPALIGSLIFGSSNGNLVWEFKSDTLSAAGTAYSGFGANVAIDASGTFRGAAFWLSRWARTAGTSSPAANGWSAVGTNLA